MRLAAALLFAALASGSSTTSTVETSVTKTIGPDGGSIVVAGATVTFPKGALAEAKSITISATDASPPDGFVAVSKVFKCEPSGTSFAEPVTMEMPFTDDGNAKTMFWSSGSDPAFKDVGGETAGATMRATVRHFSSGFVGRKK